MSYEEIFILGWNLNALMFVLNLVLAFKVISSAKRSELEEESLVLKNLKEKLDSYYPYRTYTTLFSYLIPFTACFRITYKIFEMYVFIQKNQGSKMFDYMVYKYQEDIKRAENK